MRRLLMIAVAALALAGCDTSPASNAYQPRTTVSFPATTLTPASVTTTMQATAAPPLTATTASTDTATVDQAFIGTIDAEGIYYPSRAAALSLARAVCSDFDKGMSFLDEQAAVTISSAMSGGGTNAYSAQQSAFFIGVSVAAYCPQHRGLLPH